MRESRMEAALQTYVPNRSTAVPEHQHSCEIRVSGLVQGVGFRPFVYRLAHQHKLAGWVHNTDDGVVIRVEGSPHQIESFLDKLRTHPPSAAQLYSVEQVTCEPGGFADFRIVKSCSKTDRITQVCPDITVCDECLQDMKSQPHRLDYPFINCTHCGPRFTIIRELPYDRPSTTMAPFEMCDTCHSEYESPGDRRFHAQPVACNECGPVYTLIRHGREDAAGGRRDRHVTGITNILEMCVRLIAEGGIIAIKGLGGYHLMCDAVNEAAVRRLRDAKLRDGKPFAVMVRDGESAGRFCEITTQEAEVLASWRRPIVLLRERIGARDKNPSGRGREQTEQADQAAQTNQSEQTAKADQTVRPLDRELPGQESLSSHSFRPASDINPGCATVGVMLPYMPFHHLLFERIPDAVLVMTSGNLSDEPIVMDNDVAVRTFRHMSDATLVYNRDIHNRTDDSVVFVARKAPRIIRRSRGHVPEPVRLAWPAEGILAAGAELSHCFAVGKGYEAMLSQHIGDLKDPSTFSFFEESVSRFCSLFRVKPTVAACDLHPDYLSTRYAHQLGLPVVEVQHHHAHIAACMAEFHLDEPVIGVCWDGTGLGTDGNMWGGEFLHADLTSFERFAHFRYLPLPGGDKAAKQTWRSGLSLLHQVYGEDYRELDLPIVRDLKAKPDWSMIQQAIERRVNSPLSSAAGRLFDAVAAITGVCHHNSYHAEAPMKLEAIADAQESDEYDFYLQSEEISMALPDKPAPFEVRAESRTISAQTVINPDPMIRAIVADLQNGVPLPIISAKYHNTLVSVIEAVSLRMKSLYSTKRIILTGGVFQNRYLLEKSEERLESAGFEVFSPLAIPANDAGIALGQLAVAARRQMT